MYTYEDRMKAVTLYLKYDRNSAAVRRELGYPSSKALRLWVKKYETTGRLHAEFRTRTPRYSPEQKQAAIDYYLQHGRSISRCVRALGCPNRETLRQWLAEAGVRKSVPVTGGLSSTKVELTKEQKRAAVIDLCSRSGSAQEVADRYGVTRAALYQWKNDVLGKGNPMGTKRPQKATPDVDKNLLLAKVETLQGQVGTLEKQIHQLRLEKDIIEATAEILKKDQGADPKRLTNREKAVVIGALRKRHPLCKLLNSLAIAKSSYFYQCASLATLDKYINLRKRVRHIFDEAGGRYGYRRIHAVLQKNGQRVSEKVVRRLMREESLTVLRSKRRKYNSYKGELSPAVPNLIQRNFHATEPNIKWLTDITEFALPAGKVYLSPIIDCFDGLVVSWSISTIPDANLVNMMLDGATQALSQGQYPIVHSDRGSHYRWPGWITRMEARGLMRSMSKKGCTADNAACEGFFGRIKNEMFYGRSWAGVSVVEFINQLDRYLHWYNYDRIKMSLGAKSPMEYRRSIGYA